MAIISILIFVVLGGLTFFLYKHNRMAYYLTLGFFIFTSILTIFDDFGITDLVVLSLGIIPIILLIKDRSIQVDQNWRKYPIQKEEILGDPIDVLWRHFHKIIKDEDFRRKTHGAKDSISSKITQPGCGLSLALNEMNATNIAQIRFKPTAGE
jgi:hypothetical protein